MKISATPNDWHDIICCGLENQQIDFKSHQNWETIGRTGRAKFARHAMALANTQGGYVVVGVSEDDSGIPNNFTGMTEEEASSFDPSTVGQTINTFADPPVSLDIVRPMVDGKRYVVMVVYPFSDIPHVCSENCEHELQRGGFYIRTPDARSKLAAKSSEIHPLIRRALRNQRQMLGRMLRGILYEDKQTDSQNGDFAIPALEQSRRLAAETFGRKTLQDESITEIHAYPESPLPDIRLGDLRDALEQLEHPMLSDIQPEKTLAMTTELFASNESIRGVFKLDNTPFAYWEFTVNGVFYLATLNQNNDSSSLDILQMSQIAFHSLAALGQLYSQLNHPDALLTLDLHISKTENKRLVNFPFDDAVPSGATSSRGICRIPEIQIAFQRTPADLEGGAAAETAAMMASEICQRFNMPVTSRDIAVLRKKIE